MTEISVARDGIDEGEPPSSAWVERVVRSTLNVVGFEQDCEVSVLLTNDARIQQLNLEYRGQDKPTDVLSFALEEDSMCALPPGCPRLLGDVILSLETIARQAPNRHAGVAAECAWALCHGVLHLLGFDHQTDAQEDEMRAKERAVLAQLGEAAQTW